MKSSVGAIIGADGELRRVVIAARDSLELHVCADERLVIMPGLEVQEPLTWNEGLALARQVAGYVKP